MYLVVEGRRYNDKETFGWELELVEFSVCQNHWVGGDWNFGGIYQWQGRDAIGVEGEEGGLQTDLNLSLKSSWLRDLD